MGNITGRGEADHGGQRGIKRKREANEEQEISEHSDVLNTPKRLKSNFSLYFAQQHRSFTQLICHGYILLPQLLRYSANINDHRFAYCVNIDHGPQQTLKATKLGQIESYISRMPRY